MYRQSNVSIQHTHTHTHDHLCIPYHPAPKFLGLGLAVQVLDKWHRQIVKMDWMTLLWPSEVVVCVQVGSLLCHPIPKHDTIPILGVSWCWDTAICGEFLIVETFPFDIGWLFHLV